MKYPKFNVTHEYVFGTKYKIVQVKAMKDYGECDRCNKVIYIKATISDRSKWDTYYHELFHSIATESGLWQGIHPDMEQIAAENFAKYMMSLLERQKLTLIR
jgi:hypothetical protein